MSNPITSKKVGNKKVKDPQNALIRESMKCPVCLETLLPPIYQCETGHNICSSCVENVQICPLCKGDYGDTRNYFAEELVNSMTFTCKFDVYGCQTSCLGAKLKEHQATCEFQPYRCPELACKELMGIHQMAKHMDKHGFRILKGQSHIATIDIQDEHFDKKTEYNPWRIEAFGREFYTVSVRRKDGNWFFWAWVLGLPKEAKAYSYEMAIFTQEKQVVYRGPVQSLRSSPEDLMKTENCLVIHDQLIKSFRNDTKINCSVRFIEGKIWYAKKLTKPKSMTPTGTKTTAKGVSKEPVKKTTRANSASGTCPGPPPNTPVTSPYNAPKSKTNGNLVTKSKSLGLSNKGSPPTVRHNSGVSYLKRRITEEENRFVHKMRQTLKCPGCEQVISPPILQCSIGHNICSNCRAVREDCPLCRAPIGISRNFFAEELLYRTVQRCRYNRTGCEVCLPIAQIRLHELTCDFAPFECPFSSCRQTFDPRNLLSHLKSHNITVVDDELKSRIAVPKSPSSSDRICAIPAVVMADGYPFYPLVVRDQGTLWSFWVCSPEHGNYKYEIILKKQSRILSFQGPVLSLRMDQAHVLMNGLALITTDRVIRGMKTDNQLDYTLKIAPIRPSHVLRKTSFSINLGINFKKFKTNNTTFARTELYANEQTSVSSPEQSYEEMDDFEFLETLPDLPTRTLSAVDEESTATETDEGAEAIKRLEDFIVPSSSFHKLPENRWTASDSTTEPKASKCLLDKSLVPPSPSSSLTSTASQTVTSIMPKHTLESLIRDVEATLAMKLSEELPPAFELMNGRNPMHQLPEVISSYPILPSVAQIKHHQNVRMAAWKRKRNMQKFKMVLASKSNIWTSTPSESQAQFELVSGSVPRINFKKGNYDNADVVFSPLELPQTAPLDVHVHVPVPTGQNKAEELDTGNAAEESDPNKCRTSSKHQRKSPSKKSKKSTSSGPKPKKNVNNSLPTSMISSQVSTPSRSSSIQIPIVQAHASLDISVEQKGLYWSGGQPGNWKNSKFASGSVSEGEESYSEIVDGKTSKVLPTRSNLRVKFADQTPEIKNIHPHDSMFHLTINGVPNIKPMKSSLKISESVQTGESLALPTIHEDGSNSVENLIVSAKTSEIATESKAIELAKVSSTNFSRRSMSPVKRDINNNVNYTVDDFLNGSDAFKSGSDDVKTFLGDQPLIDLCDTSLDIPPSCFDTAMFKTSNEPRVEVSLPIGTTILEDLTTKDSRLIISECDLLKHNAQPATSNDNIKRGFPTTTSSKSLGSLKLSTGGLNDCLSDCPDEDDDNITVQRIRKAQSVPAVMQCEETQTVEETQTACQVGSSLLKLNEANDGEAEESNNVDESDDPSLFDQSMDTIAGGITCTLNAVKSILSGFVSATTGDDYDEDDDDNENEEPVIEEDFNGNLALKTEDFGGYDDESDGGYL